MSRASSGSFLALIWFAAGCHAGPRVDSVSPASGAAAGGAEVIVSGSDLDVGVSVSFGDQPATQVQRVSATQVWAVTPPGTGSVDVKVRNPNGASADRLDAYSYITHPVTRPGCATYSQLRPPGCPAPPVGFQLDLSQVGITGAQQVQFASDFSNWNPSAMQQAEPGSTVWTTAVEGMWPGRREYKFLVDGNWVADPNAPAEPIFGNSLKFVVDPCLPQVSITSPPLGASLPDAPVQVLASATPGIATDGMLRTIAASNVLLCVDDVPYPVTPDASGQISTKLPLGAGRHRLSVQAQDSGGFTSINDWTWFNVAPKSATAPVANPGPTFFARLGTEVIIDGSNSWDPDGNPLTSFNWSTVNASVSFDAGMLPDGYLSAPEGYQSTYGMDDPNAMPARTPARKLYTPEMPGISTVQLTVADEHGASTNPINQTQIVALPSTGPIPQVVLALSNPSFGPITIDASNSQASPTATFQWIADVANPAVIDPTQYLSADGMTLTLPRTLFTEGVWRFWVVINDSGGASWPGGAQVLVRDGLLRVDDYMRGPAWAYEGPMDEIFVRKFYDSNGDGIGDLNGVTQKLDYLQGLGIQSLWLMPVFTSDDHDHGYHPDDYYDVEPDYGTRADLLNLIKEAHARNMQIILDLVINHTSRHHPFFLDSLSDFIGPDAAPGDWFSSSYIWFDNSESGLLNKYGWGRQLGGARLTLAEGWADIPDIDYGDPETRSYFFNMAKYWADPNGDGDFSDGVDGYRLDHVTGPDHSVWMAFRSELKALNPDLMLVGEVFTDYDDGDSGYGIKDYYHGEMDSCFDFPIFYAFQALMSGTSGAVASLQSTVDELFTTRFPIGALHHDFLENQDVPDPTDYAQFGGTELQMALTIEVALPSVPHAIWGQELGLSVWRGFVPWNLEGPQNQLENTFRAVMTARRDQPALRSGSFEWLTVSQPDSALGVVRQLSGSPTIIVVANASASPLTGLTADLSAVDGNTLTIISGSAQGTIDSSRQLHVDLPAWTAVMYSLAP